MSLLVITSERFGDHVPPPGHPERPERAEVMDVVAARWHARGGRTTGPRAASREELLRAHSERHIDMIAATAGTAVALDPDTFTSPDSYDVALFAAGAAVQAVDAALAGESALALVRPPGHHAERTRAMGFCLFNNVAVAAAQALHRGVERVAIVDCDVHHGNGTQWIFYEEPRVLYVSTHQYPFYPGTGSVEEIGRDAGAGCTLNIPLEAGATDADYDLVFTQVILPVLDEYVPELLIMSAGYDAHVHDPLGGMRVSTDGYARMTRHLQDVADRHCGGAIAAVTEGGYDLRALAACLEATMRVLDGAGATAPPPPEGTADRARLVLDSVVEIQKRFWRAL